MSDAERSVFAHLTPPGRGGIAVVRATGPAVADALAACFRPVGGAPFEPAAEAAGHPDLPWPTTRADGYDPLLPQRARTAPREALPPGRLAYGHVVDAGGEVLDEVILHRAGPVTWEVNCHGGPAAVAAVGARLAALGLEQVDSDTLLAAEGVGSIERAARRRLRSAATPLAARILLDQFVPDVRGGQGNGKRGGSEEEKRGGSPHPPRDKTAREERAVGTSRLPSGQAPPRRATRFSGALGQAVAGIADALAAGRTDEAAAGIDALLDRWETCGRHLADPPRVVLAGRPNVGKSTLLNRLAGRERAITHPEPGTTRDYVETVAALDGLPVVLVDTAGVRETLERIEREGVTRARHQAAGADLVVYLLDAAAGATAEDETALADLRERGAHSCEARGGCGDPPRPHVQPLLAVWNKADLADGPLGAPGDLAVSAETGEGLDALRQEVLERLGYRAPPPGTAVPFAPEQAEALRVAAQHLDEGRADEAARALASLVPQR
jgi:hypothetical protein